MNRARGVLIAVLATCAFGFVAASPVSATYPPGAPTLKTPSSIVNAGAPVTLNATGFVAGAVVTFAIGGSSLGTATANAAGSATLVASAPATAGTFTVTASSPDGRTASLSLTVLPAGAPIPATGADSQHPSLIAGVLVLIGVGLVGATLVRRRSRALAPS